MDEEFSSALLTGRGPIGFLMLGSTCKTCRAIRPPHADQSAAGDEFAAHRLPPTNDPRVHPAYPGRPRGRAGHCPTTSHDDGQVQTETSAGPAPPAPASSTRRRLRQTTSRAWTQRATTLTPAIPAVRRPAQRRAPRPHSGRTQRTRQRTNTGRPDRTPTPDAGQRTPGRSDARTGHRTSVPWTGKRGHWSLAPDTGHRTLDTGHRTLAEDVDRLTKARPASGPPGHHAERPARWDAQPCSCERRLRRSAAHAGSAVRPPARDSVSPAAAWSLAGVERRLGALLSSDDYGSSVERAAKLHPLWQGAGLAQSWSRQSLLCSLAAKN
jgi:hypothetical protein